MIRITLDRPATNFEYSFETRDWTGESYDGMRRSTSYDVRHTRIFSFTNEKREEAGFAYDLNVEVRRSSGWINEDVTKDEKAFAENLKWIVKDLKDKGLTLIAPTYYRKVRFAPSASDKLKLVVGDDAYLRSSTDDVTSYLTLLERIRTDKGMRISRAIGDKSVGKIWYKVEPDTIPTEESFVPVEATSLEAMLASGEISEDDVRQELLAIVAQAKGDYEKMSMQGLEKFVLAMTLEEKHEAMRLFKQDNEHLDLFRKYRPESICWSDVPLKQLRNSDLDLMIQREYRPYYDQDWKFLEQCMGKPELEQKVVENVCALCYCDWARIARNLHNFTTTDILRSVCSYVESKGIQYSRIKELFHLQYERLEQDDYWRWLQLAAKVECKSPDEKGKLTLFLLKLGVTTKVSDNELVTMLESRCSKLMLHEYAFRTAYKELDFAPGLEWNAEEMRRIEAEKQRIAQEEAESNERVVSFVRKSGKMAVRVHMDIPFSEKAKTSTLDGEVIGHLKTSEKRIFQIECAGCDYLLDVERVKKARNGILHIDVAKEDAGYIIGTKGRRLNKIAEDLRTLGCEIQSIRIHSV